MTVVAADDSLQRLTVAVARLEERMGALFTLVEQSAKAVQDRAVAQSERDADHEARLRALEGRSVVTWPGMLTTMGGVGSLAVIAVTLIDRLVG